MLNRLFERYMYNKKMRLQYQIDKEAMVAYVDVNKPDKFIIGDDRNALDALCNHFAGAGYCVIVRD